MTDAPNASDLAELLKKKFVLTVTAYPLAFTPWVYFSMEDDYSSSGGKKVGENLKFDKGKGAFELTFKLEDYSDRGLIFCRPFADAIWVAAGPLCPTEAGNGGGAITEALPMKDKELFVNNANDVPELLSFALRFTGTDPSGDAATYVYDPRIINNGR